MAYTLWGLQFFVSFCTTKKQQNKAMSNVSVINIQVRGWDFVVIEHFCGIEKWKRFKFKKQTLQKCHTSLPLMIQLQSNQNIANLLHKFYLIGEFWSW